MELWIATTNRGKLQEIKSILSGLNIEVKSIEDLNSYFPPEETGKTFLENARIKAKSLASVKSGCWVLAEDSGLEVPGLNNYPGVYSARYAGDNASDLENTSKLLKMVSLRCATKREASFKATMVAIAPDKSEHVFEGELKGKIANQMRGKNGFGYDPVFIPDGFEHTTAEMSPGEKNKISHRGIALKSFVEFLKSQR